MFFGRDSRVEWAEQDFISTTVPHYSCILLLWGYLQYSVDVSSKLIFIIILRTNNVFIEQNY